MKTDSIIVCIALSLLLPSSGFTQSTFHFANFNGPFINAPVFDAQGTALAGTNYLAELYGGATANSLSPLVIINQGNRREIVPFVINGYFVSTSASLAVLAVPPGGLAWLQARAWDARLGATYEDVTALGIGGYGESPLFNTRGGDPFDQFPIPGPLYGLQSFSLRPVVPEPSTWALFALGGGAFAWVARRKRHRRS